MTLREYLADWPRAVFEVDGRRRKFRTNDAMGNVIWNGLPADVECPPNLYLFDWTDVRRFLRGH